jgi:diacylglycerol kinase (ATP)
VGPVRERKTVARSFRFAVEGLMHALHTQRHMRAHFAITAAVMALAIVLQVSTEQLLIMFLTISLVLITELFNTALESAIDLAVRSYHPVAKLAKDVSAGAVLVASVNAVLVGTVIFASNPRLGQLLQAIPPVNWGAATTRLAAIGTILVSLAVVLIKTRTGQGTLMRGGVVSGHTALAFFFATMVILITRNAPASLLAVAIAGMLAHSRVQAGIHSLGQVVMGALLGCSLTALFFGLLYLTGSVWAAAGP